MQLLALELNEINFKFVKKYVSEDLLPNFAEILNQNGLNYTTSESEYDAIEPWIQWVTAHTGLDYSEHKVFRLGDITQKPQEQIWEKLEKNHGTRVGAVSPMNALNTLADPAFFVPDPWTSTKVSGPFLTKKLFSAIKQSVSDNAKDEIKKSSYFWLMIGAARYAQPKNYLKYLNLVLGVKKGRWRKAIFLDLLLFDLTLSLSKLKRPDFVSLFLNAGAHIQHHYMFSSKHYNGALKNPSWYHDGDSDPILEVYSIYDHLIGQFRKSFPNTRIQICTGLHQEPYETEKYYWRLKAHENWLNKAGIPYKNVLPRMSRDFIIECPSAREAKIAEKKLKSCIALDGLPIYSVDNRKSDLFVTLIYPKEITRDFRYNVDGKEYTDFSDDVAFVALKNGKHNGTGYFLDTGILSVEANKELKLKDIFQRTISAASSR